MKESGTTTLNQTRTHQTVNEITAISGGGVTPGYDPNGNLTTMPKVDQWSTAQTVTWDAWNRPITVVEGSTTLGTYQYDGLNRRIWKESDEGGTLTTRHFYYSNQWQVLEERTGSSTTADRQYVWGIRYEDDLVLRDRFGGTSERFYSLGDYFQPTALADTTGVVQERYVYRAFGDVSYYNGSFVAQADSSCFWSFLYGSYYLDRQTLLYQVRNRYYHTALGRWLSRDPLGSSIDVTDYRARYYSPNIGRFLSRDPYVDDYGNGAELTQGPNLYWYVQDNGINKVDPFGLAGCPSNAIATEASNPTLSDEGDISGNFLYNELTDLMHNIRKITNPNNNPFPILTFTNICQDPDYPHLLAGGAASSLGLEVTVNPKANSAVVDVHSSGLEGRFENAWNHAQFVLRLKQGYIIVCCGCKAT